MSNHLERFEVESSVKPVEFVETVMVRQGVTCDIYRFLNDTSQDLGVITVSAGQKTPLQKVLSGDKTVEGYLRGKGRLSVFTTNQTYIYEFPGAEPEVVVHIGDTMQWQASSDTNLTFYEICTPPYKDGRFENIDEG
jgi:hypothetical protein